MNIRNSKKVAALYSAVELDSGVGGERIECAALKRNLHNHHDYQLTMPLENEIEWALYLSSRLTHSSAEARCSWSCFQQSFISASISVGALAGTGGCRM
jgi:hypothetical protein